MSLSFPHRLRVYLPGVAGSAGGYQDDDGIWHDDPTVPDDITLYDDVADVQDSGGMFTQGKFGEPVEGSNAVAFLRHPSQAHALANKMNLKAEITWENDTVTVADVLKVRRLDGTVWLHHTEGT